MGNEKVMELNLIFHKEWAASAGQTVPGEIFADRFKAEMPEAEAKEKEAFSCKLIIKELADENDIIQLVKEILQKDFNAEVPEKAADWKVTVENNEQPAQIGCLLINLVFKDKYVLARRNDEKLPVEVFIASMKKACPNILVVNSKLTGCTLQGQEIPGGLEDLIKDILSEQGTLPEEYSLDIRKAPPVNINDGKSGGNKSETKEKPGFHNRPSELRDAVLRAGGEEARGTAAEAISNLIGAQALKELSKELTQIAPIVLRRNTFSAFASRCYLFSMEEGCGLSFALSLLARQISELGLYEFNGSNLVEEFGENENPEELLEKVTRLRHMKHLLCVDISQWLDRLGSREFRLFLQQLAAVQKERIFVFRIPFLDEVTRRDVFNILSDVFFVREALFPPFSMEQLRQYAAVLLDEYDFTMEEAAWAVFDEKIAAEKSDGCFYGLRTVKKVVDEIVFQKHLYDAENNAAINEETVIAGKELKALAGDIDSGSAMEQLNGLIGIEPVKKRILEVLAQIELSKNNPAFERPCLHMQFLGGPGTGKTTVARILGKLLKERGLLSKGMFFEYAGRDFCGRFIGETAPKTAAMCRDAYGSVLFIDEAYSLFRGNKDSGDFGREAIDTLIAQMENHRDDLVVIMAGYEEDMAVLMQANPGMTSRIPYAIEFPSYDRETLHRIFMSMVSSRFDYDEGFEAVAKEYFSSLSDHVLSSKDFSNARFVRNLFERTWGKAASRRQMEPDIPFVLTECDFNKAIAEGEFAALQERRQGRLGFALTSVK